MRRFLGTDIQVLRHAMKKVRSGMCDWHGRVYLFPDEMHNDVGQSSCGEEWSSVDLYERCVLGSLHKR